MLIRLTDITAKGLELVEQLNLSALNQRMNEGRANEIQFISAPKCSLKIHRQGGGLNLTGVVTTTYKQPCARCANELEMPLTVPIDIILKATNPEKIDHIEDDIGVVVYSGEHLDLEPTLQEYIILATSPYLKPELDANNNCLLCERPCSANQKNTASDETINLGMLLKDALRKK